LRYSYINYYLNSHANYYFCSSAPDASALNNAFELRSIWRISMLR